MGLCLQRLSSKVGISRELGMTECHKAVQGAGHRRSRQNEPRMIIKGMEERVASGDIEEEEVVGFRERSWVRDAGERKNEPRL